MDREIVNTLLIRKYDQPVPRYTSYPTVPFWSEQFGASDWIPVFKSSFDNKTWLKVFPYIYIFHSANHFVLIADAIRRSLPTIG
jgi:hypothetical protein